jgi:L-rhamnose 1-dehydrogenase
MLYGADTRDYGTPEQLIQRTISAFGQIDVLVNSAAISHPMPAEKVTKSILQKHVDVNFVATYLATKAATRRMVDQGQGGSIVSISSNTTVVGASGLAHYAGSKAGVLALMNNFAVEFGSHGIRYNSVLPGPTETQIISDFVTDPKMREVLMAKSPMGRLAQPEDIASVVTFFASDLSRHVSGQQLLVDGGASYRFL